MKITPYVDYQETPNGLLLTLTDSGREFLQEIKEEDAGKFLTDDTMYDLLEPTIANSELQWTSAEATGDLTDAPMLCIKSYPPDNDDEGKIIHRWAFMDYQIITLQERLLETGTCLLVGE